MPSVQTYREYVLMRGQIVDWNQFVSENDWAREHQYTQQPIPDKCIAVYYLVNKDEKVINDRYCMITYDIQYKNEFKELSLVWVKQYFEVEESDIKQLETPEETIIKPGGEIFFLLDSKNVVAGVVAAVIQHGECELAKMTVRKEYTGKGLAHILMRECIQWARDRKYPHIELMSSTSLENAISLYKKYGFQTIHLGEHPAYKRCNIIMRLPLEQQQFTLHI